MNEKINKDFIKKILKIGVLTTAMMATGVGCVQNADDAGYEYPEEKPHEKTLDEINQERDQDLEIYIFNRHRFADVNDTLMGDGTKEQHLALGTRRFKEAQAFMDHKVDEFNQMVAADPNAAWLLSTQPNPGYITNDLSHYNTHSIDVTINQNNKNFAKFLAQIQYKFTQNNRNDDCYKFATCYDKLAVRAYDDSLGLKNNKYGLPTFRDDEPEINQELAEYGIPNDYHTVEATLAGLLDDVATQTGCRRATLQAAVEMALYNEGLFGLSDLGGKGYVTGDQVYKPSGSNPVQRNRSILNSFISAERFYLFMAEKDQETALTRW